MLYLLKRFQKDDKVTLFSLGLGESYIEYDTDSKSCRLVRQEYLTGKVKYVNHVIEGVFLHIPLGKLKSDKFRCFDYTDCKDDVSYIDILPGIGVFNFWGTYVSLLLHGKDDFSSFRLFSDTSFPIEISMHYFFVERIFDSKYVMYVLLFNSVKRCELLKVYVMVDSDLVKYKYSICGVDCISVGTVQPDLDARTVMVRLDGKGVFVNDTGIPVDYVNVRDTCIMCYIRFGNWCIPIYRHGTGLCLDDSSGLVLSEKDTVKLTLLRQDGNFIWFAYAVLQGTFSNRNWSAPLLILALDLGVKRYMVAKNILYFTGESYNMLRVADAARYVMLRGR